MALGACVGLRALSLVASVGTFFVIPQWHSASLGPGGATFLRYVDELQRPLELAWMLASSFAAFFFLTWLYRAYSNLTLVGRRGPKLTPARAVWSFFIPVVNLWRPYQALAELWREAGPGDQETERAGPVRAWWATWIEAHVVLALALLASLHLSSQLGAMQLGLLLWAAAQGLVLAAGVLAIRMVRALEVRFAARIDWLEAASPGRLERASCPSAIEVSSRSRRRVAG